MKRRWAALLWVLTGLVALLALLKFFVVDVYRVDSGSMRPTLFGGRDRADGEEDAQHVLVRYERHLEPERFDLVVIRSPDGTKPLVKRVCGLPGEDFCIRDGDLFVDRQRLGADVRRPAPVAVYDDRWFDPEQFFEHRRDGSVRREGDAWVVESGPQPPGSLLMFHPALRDDYLDRQHRRVPGVVEVNDAVLELEFLLEQPLAEQKLRFQLVEEGDTFEVVLAAADERGAGLRLLRRNPRTLREKPAPGSTTPPTRELVLAEAALTLAPGHWYRLSFANVDNQLRVRLPELGLDARATYEENEPWPARLPTGQKSLGPRVSFGVEGGRARFRAVRILRDLYYTDVGRFAVARPEAPDGAASSASVSLGPGDYFLLGDNSSVSTDSRHFGPVQASEFLGRPLCVVWPDPHWLHPVAGP